MAVFNFKSAVKAQKTLFEGRYPVVIINSSDITRDEQGRSYVQFYVEHEETPVNNIIRYYVHTDKSLEYFQQEMANLLQTDLNGKFDTKDLNGLVVDLVVTRTEAGYNNRLKPTRIEEEEELAI